MTAHSYQRGNEIVSDGKVWTYQDGTLVSEERPCVRCGQMPTPEGYDACLGYIPGIESACCGHGVEESYQKCAYAMRV